MGCTLYLQENGIKVRGCDHGIKVRFIEGLYQSETLMKNQGKPDDYLILTFQLFEIDDIIKDLNNTHHQKYLKTVPEKQLKRLLRKLHEKIYSYGKATNLVSPSNSDEDFNKLDDEELNKVKDKMSESFEQNRVKPGDPEWKYEIDVDFEAGNGNKLESGWDSEESELEF
eukprot:gene6827-12420_t